jgi:hypothetical protein
MFQGNTLLVSCLAYSLIMKMEAIHSSETLVNLHQTRWHYIPANSIHHNNSCSPTQEIACFLCNLKVHYHVHKNPPLDLILSQMNELHALISSSFKTHFNIYYSSIYAWVSEAVSSLKLSSQKVFISSCMSHAPPTSSSLI